MGLRYKIDDIEDATDLERNDTQSSQSKNIKVEPVFTNEPYAHLIYRALMSAPGYKMALKDLYQWFRMHTDRDEIASGNSWQTGIRHNLLMNGAFSEVEEDPSSDGSERGSVWVLEPSAIAEGVRPTTAYRRGLS